MKLGKSQLQRIKILTAIAKHKAKHEAPTKQTFSLVEWNRYAYQIWHNNKLQKERK